jgi:hypothetical protein
MKNGKLLSVLLLLNVYAAAQERPVQNFISEELMKKEGVPIVNHFQLAVKKLKECPLYILDGTLELFSDSAKIEVSSLNSKKPKTYTPEAYFRTVNGLKCGNDPVYRDIDFDYLPVSAADGIVSCFNGSCRVSYKITQIFHGEPVKKKTKYCDITIKSVTIYFQKDNKGVVEGKIIGVLVEKTKTCDSNDNTNAITKN